MKGCIDIVLKLNIPLKITLQTTYMKYYYYKVSVKLLIIYLYLMKKLWRIVKLWKIVK